MNTARSESQGCKRGSSTASEDLELESSAASDMRFNATKGVNSRGITHDEMVNSVMADLVVTNCSAFIDW
eukprot:247387-Amphidinium_carterae.1